MPPIDPSTAYSTPNPSSLSQSAFNTQKNLDTYEAALDKDPYDVQKNVSVFFFAETLYAMMGIATNTTKITGVKGVLFHFVKDGSDLALIARSANGSGGTPYALKDNNWLTSPATGSGQKTVDAKEWCTMLKAFYSDNFAIVKSKTNHVLSVTSADLLPLFCGASPIPTPTRSTLSFQFIFSQKNGDWYLNLASEKNPSSTGSYAFEGQECPPECYPDTLSSVIQNLNCALQ